LKVQRPEIAGDPRVLTRPGPGAGFPPSCFPSNSVPCVFRWLSLSTIVPRRVLGADHLGSLAATVEPQLATCVPRDPPQLEIYGTRCPSPLNSPLSSLSPGRSSPTAALSLFLWSHMRLRTLHLDFFLAPLITLFCLPSNDVHVNLVLVFRQFVGSTPLFRGFLAAPGRVRGRATRRSGSLSFPPAPSFLRWQASNGQETIVKVNLPSDDGTTRLFARASSPLFLPLC